MKILIAPDSFKGSLSSKQVAEAVEAGIKEVVPDAEVIKIPMADGGEGTVEAMIESVGGRYCTATVKSPLMEDIQAAFGLLADGKTAVIEMAAASGLPLVPPDKRNPLITTTYGTGQLVMETLNLGCTRIILGIGGSATVDGGAGLAQALGYRLIDAEGKDIAPGGGALGFVAKIIKPARLDLDAIDVTVASDVTNRLLGSEGAARVFGPQKGATPQMVEVLEKNLTHFANMIRRDLQVDITNLEGGGAAGGLGAGIYAFLSGRIISGIQIVIEMSGLAEKVKGSSLVITGEGRIDYQTAFGKAPAGVARVAREAGVPIIAVCGCLGEGFEKIKKLGIRDILNLMQIASSESEAKKNASVLLKTLIKDYMESNLNTLGQDAVQ